MIVTCRVCFQAVERLPERIERTEAYTYYRCQRCEGSFPIRTEDDDPDAEATAPPA